MKKIHLVKNVIGVVLMMLISFSTINAQNSKLQLDRQAIKAMTGCFDVDFKYTETFSPHIDYEKHYDYTSGAFEWAELVEESDDKIVIQHLLIINDSTIIKHWRQDWIFEAEKSFTYYKDNEWKFISLNRDEQKGKWTQLVYQVDDSPRYAGSATWVHVDGTSSWHNKTDSPLPRREYSKRDDYNVMKRGNRVQITPEGWLHEQDNNKIIRDESDELLAQEKGYNTYNRKPSSDCWPAQKWWKENKAMWELVRDEWEGVYNTAEHLKLAVKLEEKRLYEHLFFGDQQWDSKSIKELIESYKIQTQ